MLLEKDFAAEIRGFRDLEVFLKDAVVVLDSKSESAREIISSMVQKLLDTHPKAKDQCSLPEVMAACFTSKTGIVN